MKFLSNLKLATRIGIITTAITFTGMLLLWFVVSDRISAMVRNNITNQMIDAVESRAAVINNYVTSAEEYMNAFALGRAQLAEKSPESCAVTGSPAVY